MSDHPYLIAAAMIVTFWIVVLILGWIRARPYENGTKIRPEDQEMYETWRDRPTVIAGVDVSRREDRRIPMQSRYVERGIRPALELADQIIADQRAAHETHGEQTDAPAPGEQFYRAPQGVVAVSVGPFSVWLNRGGPTMVSEADAGGGEGLKAVVPEEWERQIVAFAMEVLRLREGWTVSDSDWTSGNRRTYE